MAPHRPTPSGCRRPQHARPPAPRYTVESRAGVCANRTFTAPLRATAQPGNQESPLHCQPARISPLALHHTIITTTSHDVLRLAGLEAARTQRIPPSALCVRFVTQSFALGFHTSRCSAGCRPPLASHCLPWWCCVKFMDARATRWMPPLDAHCLGRKCAFLSILNAATRSSPHSRRAFPAALCAVGCFSTRRTVTAASARNGKHAREPSAHGVPAVVMRSFLPPSRVTLL